MSYTRFAIYFMPPDGPLASAGAAWLGWDAARGASAIQPDVPGLEQVTRRPRKYGFHGTLKPPFRLAEGGSFDALSDAMTKLAHQTAPAACDGLELSTRSGFLALTPMGETSGLDRIAARCVEALDPFRAPAGEAELARRRANGLTQAQETNLQRWGYPYVMDQFRFHMTLSRRLAGDEVHHWHKAARAHFPPLPAPFHLDSLTLVGERADGYFEQIERLPLTG